MSSLSSTFDDFWVDEAGELDDAEVIPLPETEAPARSPRSSQSHLRWVVFPVWFLLIFVTLGAVTWQMLSVQPSVETSVVSQTIPSGEQLARPPVVQGDGADRQFLSTATFWQLVEPRFTGLRTTSDLPPVSQPSPQTARIAPPPIEKSEPAQVAARSAAPAEPVADEISSAPFARVSVAEQENRLLDRVRVRLFEGRRDQAIGELKQFVADHGSRERTIRVLSGLLVQTGRFDEASGLLSSVSAASDPELRFLKARVLAYFGDVGGALLLLRENLPPARDNHAYHALLAALYQRAGQFAEAVSAYQLLVQLAPDNSDWLLGLAISQDQLGAREEAAKAFQQMLALRLLAPDVRAYAETRVRAIGIR